MGAGEGVAEERGDCFREEEESAEGMCAADGVAVEAAWGADCVNIAAFAEIACAIVG